MKQNPKNRNNERNTSETQSLKALALKVLQRNNTRNKSETKPKNEVKQTSLKNGLLFHSKKADFCPLEFLNERGVGVMDIDPVKGILLSTDYSCNDTLRNMIGLWTLGHFERLLAVLGETRPIARKVTCKSLNLYQLPPD